MYKVLYWSTRQQGDLTLPYGLNSYMNQEEAVAATDRLWESPDMYRVEIWHNIVSLKREPVVEEWHGNPAHNKPEER